MVTTVTKPKMNILLKPVQSTVIVNAAGARLNVRTERFEPKLTGQRSAAVLLVHRDITVKQVRIQLFVRLDLSVRLVRLMKQLFRVTVVCVLKDLTLKLSVRLVKSAMEKTATIVLMGSTA